MKGMEAMQYNTLPTVLAGMVVTLLFASTGLAYPIRDLSLYEKVYLEGMISNAPVVIIDIDYVGDRVKIKEKDGFSKWVNSSRIMSKMENTLDKIDKVLGMTLIAQCSFMVENCDSNRLGRMLYRNEYHLGDPWVEDFFLRKVANHLGAVVRQTL